MDLNQTHRRHVAAAAADAMSGHVQNADVPVPPPLSAPAPNIPVAPRSDLFAQIQAGKSLRSRAAPAVAAATAVSVSSSGVSQADLMAQIQQGRKLKSIAVPPRPTFDNGKKANGALNAAMMNGIQSRLLAMQQQLAAATTRAAGATSAAAASAAAAADGW